VTYPMGKHSDFGNPELSVVADCTKWIGEASKGKGLWMTLQIAWAGTATPGKTLRFPTFPQQRYMAYAAIINGARGLNWQGGDSLVLVGDDGVLLVDTSVAQMGAKIKAAIARVSTKPIKLVINTHAHADHFCANELIAQGGAVIIGHDALRERMAKGHGQRHIGALQTGQRHPRQRHHRGKRGLSVLRHVFGRLARRDDRRRREDALAVR